MNKMIMIAYNEAIDDEVMEMLDLCGLKSYTKLTKIYGKGNTSGTHLGNDIWPGLNNVLYIVCKDNDAKRLIEEIRAARTTLGKEGVKAFVMPVEEIA
ncbi:MAG: PG0541 family transporter-associated protein [Candidatus Omnitrophota bacterium]